MKNKKGFTIIEIVVVIAILIVIAGLFSVNMIKTLNKNKDEEREVLVSTVKSAADAYVSANPEVIERLYNGYGYADLKVGDLKKAGLISADLKDPETGEILDDNAVVRAKLDNTATAKDVVTFTYPVSASELNNTSYHLEGTTLYVDYNSSMTSSTWCSSDAPKEDLKVWDNKGVIYTGPLNNFNISVEACNVNPQSSGTYNVKYTYTDISTHEEKTYTRVVYVEAAADDVMSFEVIINSNSTIALNATSVPITIKEKSGSTEPNINTNIKQEGSTYKLKDDDNDYSDVYTIEGFKTTAAGTFEAIISSLKVNSDGSKPAAVKVAYTVNDSIIEIAKETKDCTPIYTDSLECYYQGSQDNNYVKLGETGPVFRIYYMDSTNIKLIYTGTLRSNYGIISQCSPTSCCNGGRTFYHTLNGTTKFNGYSTMDSVLRNFYTSNVATKTEYLTQIKSSDRKSRNITLLGIDEYITIGKCNASGRSCVSNYVGDTWLFETSSFVQPYGAYNSGYAKLYHYVVSNAQISTRGATIEGGNRSSEAKSPVYAVKPVIQLKNPKISGGLGTQSNPWIIE